MSQPQRLQSVTLQEAEDRQNLNATAQNFLPFMPESMTDTQKDSLVDILRMLHPYVMAELKDEDVPCLSAKELKAFALNDSRLLTRCLYALGTGQVPLEDEKKCNSYWQAQQYASFCASELLVRPCIKKPGYLQRFFSDQLSITPVTRNFKEICSFLRISGSPAFLRITNAEEVCESLLKGVNYPERGLIIFAFDNFGLKKKASYDQWTLLQVTTVTEEQLKGVGFYTENYTNQISRVPRLMTSIIEETSKAGRDPADAIVGITSSDYSLLTKYVLTHIQTALKLRLPGQKDCEAIDGNGSYGVWSQCKIPMNLGLQLPAGPSGKETTCKSFPFPRLFAPRDEEDDSSEENDAYESDTNVKADNCFDCIQEHHPSFSNIGDLPVSGEYKTIYEKNNMFLDVPLHDDLAKVSVVRGIMDYALRVNKGIEQSYLFNNAGEQDVELPVQQILIPMCGDGSPVEASHRIKDADRASGSNKYEKIQFFPGGFHFLLELHRMRGKFFGDVFGLFVNKWRPSAGKMKWIMEPSDPNDVQMELPDYILAHYRCALDCLAEIRQCDHLSPVQVNEHMLERAKSYPFVMAVLLELRFAEVAFILRDSEKSGAHGDVDAFVTGVRFSLVLFTVTHAVKYVRICVEFLKWWATASDAEKLLFRNFIFTRNSPHGCPIWADRCVEWSVEHVRRVVGKHERQGQEALMKTTLARIENLVKQQRGAKDMREQDTSSSNASWNKKTKSLSNVFVKTYLLCKKLNLYGPGPVNIADSGAAAPSSNEISSHFLQMPNGEDLNGEMLKCITIGKARAKAYFQKFYIDSQNAVLRTENEMGLDVIHGTAQRMKESLEKRLQQATSTNSHELSAVCTKQILIDELKKLQVIWPQGAIPSFNPVSIRKKDLVETLSSFRAKYFRCCQGAKQQITDHIIAQEKARGSDRAEREEEFKDMFYQLDHSTSMKFEYAESIEK